MIWNPFKKEEFKTPPFEGVRFTDSDGKEYDYKPAKTIPSYEVALLLPLFMSAAMNMNTDRFAYIRKYKLEKHFKLVEEE